MSRRLRPLLLLSCLLALPVLAAEGIGRPANCPTTPVTAVSPVGVEEDAGSEPARSEDSSRSDQAATERNTGQRMRPRWQSFLPGMVR